MIVSQASAEMEKALPTAEYQCLLPYLEFVKLSREQVLFDVEQVIEYVYFPNTALVSLIAIMTSGAVVEVGVVSKEGMAGLPVCWGGEKTTIQAIVQIAGTALRMKSQPLKAEFDRGGALQQLLLRYTHRAYSCLQLDAYH